MVETEQIIIMSPDELDITCRACLENRGDTDIFHTIHEDYLLGDLYANISSLELNEEDGLPRMLCSDCTNLVIQFNIFRKRAQESETALRNSLLNHEEKNEFMTETLHYDEDPLKAESLQVTDDVFCEITIKAEPAEEAEPKKVGSKLIRKDVTCSFCNLKFDNYSVYLTHRKKEAVTRRRKLCRICNKTVKNITDHMNVHTKEKPYSCETCGDKFSYRSNLRRHKFKHIEKKPRECGICGKGFIQAASLANHIQIHHNEENILFICDICGKKFLSEQGLSYHIKRHESNSVGVFNTDYLQCHLCNKVFKSKAGLKQHMNIHKEKTLLCNECGKKFTTKSLLNFHMRSHSEIRPYSCKTCGKSFTQAQGLASHNLIHTGEKPFLCTICGKRFTQRCHLTYHMRKHSGEKPYKCTYCDKSFSLTGNLQVHTRIHTGVKPFVCNLCSKGFYASNSLKKHMKVHDDKKS